MSEIAETSPASPDDSLSLNFGSLLDRLSQKFAEVSSATVECFRFSYDGLNFDVRRLEKDGQHLFLVNATIGYMPFSVESVERREAIRSIIWGARSLPRVRFSVDTSSRISASALFDVKDLVSPDFLFYPLMLFLQEARPFIALIGQYLVAPLVLPPHPAPTDAAATEPPAPENVADEPSADA